MVLLRKRKLVAAAAETTEGTAIGSLTNADATFVAQEVSYAVEPNYIERNIVGPSFARKRGRISDKMVRVSFRVEMAGSGTVDTEPGYALLLNACGFSSTINASTSVAYTPVVPTRSAYWTGTGDNTGNIALTLWVFHDGKVKKAEHCRGSVRITGESGGLVFLEFDFMGLYADATDSAFPGLSTGALDATTPPLLESASLNLHGIGTANIIARSFTIDMGNVLVPRRDVNAEDTGIREILISDSNTTGTIDPEEVLMGETGWSSQDIMKRLMDEVTGAFTITIGSTAGNQIVISSAEEVQITNVSEEDRDDLSVHNTTLAFNATIDDANPRVLITHQ